MPNWVHNTITIHGEAALLFIDNGKFDFNQIRPVPKQIDTDDGERFWCLRNWGTKWPMSLETQSVTIKDDALVILGRTAWEPPIALLDYIHEIQPGLTIDLVATDLDETDRTWRRSWDRTPPPRCPPHAQAAHSLPGHRLPSPYTPHGRRPDHDHRSILDHLRGP